MIINLSHACFKLHIIFILGSFTWVIFVRRKIEMGFIMLKKIHLISITENSKMIEQRGNFFGGEGVRGRWGGNPHPLVEPPTKRYKPIVDYVSLTTFAFEAAMRWCRKSGMLAECQRSYHGEYFLPNATFNGIFAEKAAPISKWSKTFLPPNQKLPRSDHCLRFLLKIESCNVQY